MFLTVFSILIKKPVAFIFLSHNQQILERNKTYTVKPQKLEHGNLRTLPKVQTRISVPTKNALDSMRKVAHRETRTLEHISWCQT